MHPARATLSAVATLPATATLPAVAALPATATLPAVAALPATATLPAVATLPATATLPAVATLPATGSGHSQRRSVTRLKAERVVGDRCGEPGDSRHMIALGGATCLRTMWVSSQGIA